MNSTLSPAVTMGTNHNHDDMKGHKDMHAGHSMDMGDHMMKMYFHFSTNATILFSGWKTTSWGTMLGSCIAVFVLAALYEGLKVYRELLLRRAVLHLKYKSVPINSTTHQEPLETRTVKAPQMKMLSPAHTIQTVLHLVQIVLSYFLMLIFMTFNVWLCIAVALGATVGYFLFSWKRAVIIDINEHCH